MKKCANCNKKRAAACAETDHSPEWALSVELIKKNKRLSNLCALLFLTNALAVLMYIITFIKG